MTRQKWKKLENVGEYFAYLAILMETVTTSH